MSSGIRAFVGMTTARQPGRYRACNCLAHRLGEFGRAVSALFR
jgi:hypothetical protein